MMNKKLQKKLDDLFFGIIESMGGIGLLIGGLHGLDKVINLPFLQTMYSLGIAVVLITQGLEWLSKGLKLIFKKPYVRPMELNYNEKR